MKTKYTPFWPMNWNILCDEANEMIQREKIPQLEAARILLNKNREELDKYKLSERLILRMENYQLGIGDIFKKI